MIGRPLRSVHTNAAKGRAEGLEKSPHPAYSSREALAGNGRVAPLEGGIMRRLPAIAIALALTASAPAALGEVAGSSRPTGFALELEIAGATNAYVGELGGLGSWGLGGGGISPRLFLGAQLGQFSIGGQVGMWVSHFADEDGGDSTTWGISLGPKFDYEVWSSGPGGLYIAGALPIQITGGEGGYQAAGFGLDFGLGGRVFVARWLAASVQAGTRMDVLFRDRNGPDDVYLTWGFYGSIALRYVASR